MAPTKIKHAKVSAVADAGDNTKVQPTDWNGDHVVEFSAALAAIDALVPGADKLAFYVDGEHAALTDLSAFMRGVLALTSALDVLTVIGGANLASLSSLAGSADKVPYFSGAGSMTLANLTSFARSILASSDAASMRTVLGAVAKGGDTMTGALTLAGDPASALQAATKQYVDNTAAGLKPKASVRAASTANVNVASAPSALDGVTGAAGDRWLLKNQTTAAQNGVYVFAAAGSALVRASDFDAWAEIPGALMIVEEGATNADSGWVCTADQGGTLGTTSIGFSQFFGTGLFQPSNANLSTLAALASVANLSALAGLSGSADKMAYFTGAGAMALSTVTSAARTLLAAVDAAAQRTALGLTIGTAAGNIVALDGAAKLPAVDGSQLTNLPGGAAAATQAQQESGSATVVYTSPGTQKYHPGHPKAWVYVTQSGGVYSLAAAYGIASIAKAATGRVDIVLSTAFSSVNYAAIAMVSEGGPFVATEINANRTASNFRINIRNANSNVDVDAGFSIVFFGDLP